MRARGRTNGAGRASAMLACAAVLFSATPAWSATDAPAAKPPSAATKPPEGKPGKKKGKAAKSKKVVPAAEAAKPAAKRRKVGVGPAYIVGDSSAHFINDAAPKIVPFPENAKAFDKAFAENRRDQLADAEKTARAAKSPDRWRSVLFMLHGLPEHNDSETCFWRVLSFYRLGELERARKVRENCDLPAKDSSTLNAEDARVSGTPSMEDLLAANAAAAAGEPVAKDAGAAPGALTTAPYSGPTPQRRD